MRSLCTECCCCCCWGWGLVAAKPALLEPLLKRLLPWSAESCGACPARCCHRLLRSGSLTSVLLPPTRSPRSSPATAGTELPGLLVPRARTPISCSLLGPPPLLGPSKKPAPGGSSRWEAKVPGTLTTLELSETDCIRARLCEGKGVARTRVWLSNMEEAAGVCTRLSGGEGEPWAPPCSLLLHGHARPPDAAAAAAAAVPGAPPSLFCPWPYPQPEHQKRRGHMGA
eukprot:1160166-Pelagomonas_calceolata.AAC.2